VTKIALLLCLLSLTVIAVAQNQPLKFEVATIKPLASISHTQAHGVLLERGHRGDG
jgi:hypothetical protein